MVEISEENRDQLEEKVENLEEERVLIPEEKIKIIEKEQILNQIKTKRERSLKEDSQEFFWINSDGEKKLATENLVVGNQVYGEKLITKKGTEYRLWDPFRSKLAAAIMNGLEIFPFKKKSSVLYLGVSTVQQLVIFQTLLDLQE